MQISKNQKLILNIESIANSGAGVARYNDIVVFVPRALPGETAEVQIIKTAKNYCVGRLLNIIKASEARQKPECEYFGRCGGCVLQHMQYRAQLESKRNETQQVLRRISGLEFNVEDCIGMDNPYGYRNKALLPVGRAKDGTVRIGFYSEHSHNIVDTDNCLIQGMDIMPFVSAVKELLKQTGTSVYDETVHSGSLRHIMLRKSYAFGSIMAVLVTNEPLKQPEKWTERLMRAGAVSVWNNINTAKGNVILSDKCRHMGGEQYIQDELCGIKFRLSPLSFLQVNPVQTQKLYTLAAELSGVGPGDTVLDAYCGIGIMTQLFARRCSGAIGVEIVPDAIENARMSAELNGISNAEFYTGDCALMLPELIAKNGTVDCLVVDPPRAGCDKGLLEAVGGSGIDKIVYVSCDPATLARDAAILAGFGFAPVRTVCVDMFPQTKHVECVVLMSRVDKVR